MNSNVIKGWITSLLGLVIMITAGLDFFGIVNLPAPDGMTAKEQVFVAFLAGIALFLVRPTFLERKLKTLINKKIQENG